MDHRIKLKCRIVDYCYFLDDVKVPFVRHQSTSQSIRKSFSCSTSNLTTSSDQPGNIRRSKTSSVEIIHARLVRPGTRRLVQEHWSVKTTYNAIMMILSVSWCPLYAFNRVRILKTKPHVICKQIVGTETNVCFLKSLTIWIISVDHHARMRAIKFKWRLLLFLRWSIMTWKLRSYFNSQPANRFGSHLPLLRIWSLPLDQPASVKKPDMSVLVDFATADVKCYSTNSSDCATASWPGNGEVESG